MNKIIVLLILISAQPVFAQKIMDTVDIKDGTMVVYKNRTWEFLHDINFDGVMNERLHSEVVLDSSIGFVQTWDRDMCYTSGHSNDISKIKEPIWMCLEGDQQDKFSRPAEGIITSSYGWRRGRNHNGTDINLNTGDTVRAAWGGKVRYSRYNDGGFGNLVVIRHYNGLETFYAHLSKLLVVPNQLVESGEAIALGGNTGRSYGSHLHFEIRFYDIPIDSEKIIDYKTNTVVDENLIIERSKFKSGSSSSKVVAAKTSGGGKYYRVRSGDTLGAIASRNRTTVSRICQLNGIRPTTILQIGRNLRIR